MLIKNLLAHKKIFFWIALTFTIFFTYLFLQSGSKLPKINIDNIDKIFHAIFHFIFIIIWFLSFQTRNKNNLLKAFAFSILYGITIELAQDQFTTNRQADFFDVIANTFGAFLGLIVILYKIKARK